MENLSVDSTCVKVHESANGGKKTADKAVGRTRGGWNTKLHALVDGLGNPVEFLLSAGNDHDSVHAVELLEKSGSEGVPYWQTGHMVLGQFGNISQRTGPAM